MSLSRTFRTSLLVLALAAPATAGTVVLSTTTYPGGPVPTDVVGALPKAGAYMFDVVVKSTAGAAFTTVDLYLQQEGVSGGAYYTIFNSTITQCTAVCTRLLVPDIYLGGNIRSWWTVAGASATITVTAREVTP